jgi:hypothetical protein
MHIGKTKYFICKLHNFISPLCSAVAVARLLVGAWHVLDHLRVAITVFRSEITDVSGSASGTTLCHTVRILIDASLKMFPRI